MRFVKTTILKSEKGFTLVEMLVAMNLFVVLLLASLTIFSFSQKNNTRLKETELVSNEARIIVEKIAHDIRLSAFDYAADWPGESGAVKELRLVDPAGQKIIYQLGGAGCPVERPACLAFGLVDSLSGQIAWSAVNSDLLNINTANSYFYLYPLVDPLIGNSQSTSQPRATIFLDFNGGKNGDKNLILQTTVSSRVYKH